eukprot:3667260-Rhodomonas_salina.1
MMTNNVAGDAQNVTCSTCRAWFVPSGPGRKKRGKGRRAKRKERKGARRGDTLPDGGSEQGREQGRMERRN